MPLHFQLHHNKQPTNPHQGYSTLTTHTHTHSNMEKRLGFQSDRYFQQKYYLCRFVGILSFELSNVPTSQNQCNTNLWKKNGPSLNERQPSRKEFQNISNFVDPPECGPIPSTMDSWKDDSTDTYKRSALSTVALATSRIMEVQANP